ncbi:hypothetical protein Selli2_14900 [Sellimonas catena]|uniref:Uncharacterized protein n=1 Tax=Sellimonas catena TaxID=2994035 RepID=A0A9W6C9R2_9FIRM|nr:hypothetical protein Selli2_14900 [Sellimonas catena]
MKAFLYTTTEQVEFSGICSGFMTGHCRFCMAGTVKNERNSIFSVAYQVRIRL